MQMIADVEPLSGIRRYPSLPLGSSWERHTLALQYNPFPKQASWTAQDRMTFGDEDLASPGLLDCPALSLLSRHTVAQVLQCLQGFDHGLDAPSHAA